MRRTKVKSAETTYRAILLNVMVAMMEVDRSIDEHEVEQIGDIYEEIVGFRLETEVRERLIGSLTTPRREVLDMVRKYGPSLDTEQRKLVIRGALYVLKADGKVAPYENWFLSKVGLAFGMTNDELEAILHEAEADG